MRLVYLPLLALAFMALPFGLQAQTAQPKLASRQLAEELISVSNTADQMQQSIELMLQTMQSNQQIPSRYLELFRAEIQIDSLVQPLVRLYQERFSDEELRAVIRFYKTPEGQKILKELPSIQQESYRIGSEYGARAGQRALARFQQEQAATQPADESSDERP